MQSKWRRREEKEEKITIVKNVTDRSKLKWFGGGNWNHKWRVKFDRNVLREKITGKFTTKKDVNSLKINQQM